MKKILLTFDLEEFDLPKEFNINLSEDQMYKISLRGLNKIQELLKKHNLTATFFTTANFAKKYPKTIKQLSKDNHEIASHGYSHSQQLTLKNLKEAKEAKEKIINKPIKGFRAPRWDLKNINHVEQAGFSYDSSSHPIYLPGRYSNLNKNRKPHKIGNMIEIPPSTLPPNFSIFWLAFKNFPLVYSKIFTKINFLNSNYTMLLMHPWEFSKIKHFKLPKYINSIDDKKLLKKFEKYILFCKKNKYNFERVDKYINKINNL